MKLKILAIFSQYSVFIIALISLLIACLIQSSILFNQYAFEGDSITEVYGGNISLLPPNPNDVMAMYSDWLVPIGTKIIYVLGSRVVPAGIIAKFIPLLTSVFSMVLLYHIVLFMTGEKRYAFYGVSCALLSVWFLRERQIFGAGDSEDISILLFICFVYLFIKKKWLWMAALFVIESLFYPPTFLHSAISIGLWFFLTRSAHGKISIPKKHFTLLVCAAFVSCGYLLMRYEIMRPPVIGAALTTEEGRNAGELRTDSRTPIFGQKDTILSRIKNDMTGIGWDAVWQYSFPWLCVLLFCFLNKPYRHANFLMIRAELVCYLIAGFLLCIVANGLLFKLYMPSRYIQHQLNIFVQIILAIFLLNLNRFLFFSKKPFFYYFLISIYITGLSLVTIPHFGSHAENYSDRRNLIHAVRQLPSNSFIAGNPDDMTDIAYLGNRRVYLTYKMSTDVFWKSYQKKMTKMTLDFFNAYYSDSLTDVIKFCHDYSVSHIIVEARHFSPEYLDGEEIFYPPYDVFISKLDKGRRFLFQKIPNSWCAWRDENICIVDVAKIRSRRDDNIRYDGK